MPKAKIIATIGPASESRETLRSLIDSGMDVARLNFSHGNHETYTRIIEDLRDLSDARGQPVAILQDLAGIKVRTGPLRNHEPVTLREGQSITITSEPVQGNASRICTNYAGLAGDVKAGDRLLLSDGLIELRVIENREGDIECEVVVGGELAEHQGINIPGANLSAPPLTDKDIRDLEFGVEHEVDFMALSFVREAADVAALRRELEARDSEVPIIAKLEKSSSIENLENILKVAEGVMIARGDLGVEVEPERVPVMQKCVITSANRAGKLVITATQMLDSMIRNPRPTRAEASDVANAVIDGTDAVMLSGETAIGQYPLRAVTMMCRIVREAESLPVAAPFRSVAGEGLLSFPEAVCNSAYHAAKSVHARYIVAFTQSGSTAQVISKFRPQAEILGVTPHPAIMRRLSLFWGVRPMLMGLIENVDELILATEELLLKEGMVEAGDNLVILTGAPIVERGNTSLMKLHQVGSGG